MEDDEESRLTKIAEEFLDDEGVTNSDIREAYIDYYVDKNEKVYDLRNEYISRMKYSLITDFYVIFLNAIEDRERLKLIESKIGNEELEKILQEIKEYEEYMETDEFVEEMQGNLEEI